MTIVELEGNLEKCSQEYDAHQRASVEAQELISKLTAIVGAKHPVSIGSATKPESSKFTADGGDATGPQGCQAVKRARNSTLVSTSSSNDQRNLTPKGSRIHHDLKSSSAANGKRHVMKTNDNLQLVGKAPLTAPREFWPPPGWKPMVSMQSRTLGKTFASLPQAFKGVDENISPPIESGESFGNVNIFTSTSPDQLSALDTDAPSSTYDGTSSVA